MVRRRRQRHRRRADFVDRRYWLVVLEAGALFGGLAVVNGVLHRTAVSVAWVALVVGVHFFGLARIWRMPLYHWLGAAMTVLGLSGFLIYALGGTAATVGWWPGSARAWRSMPRSARLCATRSAAGIPSPPRTPRHRAAPPVPRLSRAS